MRCDFVFVSFRDESDQSFEADVMLLAAGIAIIICYVAVVMGQILPIFDLVYVQNDGVSFGMFGGMPWWGLSALALLICAVLGVLLFRSDNRIEAVALGAIIGGALGNVVDRFRFQAVTDFLSFHIAGLYWPAFNLADVFVVCGVGVLLLYPVWDARRQA